MLGPVQLVVDSNSLEYRRLTSRLVMFYKITHDLIDINAPSYSLPGDARTRGANRYRQPATDKGFPFELVYHRCYTTWSAVIKVTANKSGSSSLDPLE
jgi:hypothetical protein